MSDSSQALRFGPISAAAPGALYDQIVAAVKREVGAGRLVAGDRLPSVRALAADLLVSVITVKRAYEELERDGIVYSRQGLGAFLAEAGAERLRHQQAEAAGAALGAAIAAGRAAGLTDDDLLTMFKARLARGENS
jgi:GntR family transcriptional regulator